MLKQINDLYNASYVTLIMLVSMMRINAKATPTNDTDYNCYIEAIKLV